MRRVFCSPAVPLSLSVCECGVAGSASCRTARPVHSTIRHLSGSSPVAASPFRPCCPSLSLLPVWMNVSSLSPWLLDFREVRFSVSSGFFLFLNCRCPSFGCGRRHMVSTYASILAGRLEWGFSVHVLEGRSTETEACHSPKIV